MIVKGISMASGVGVSEIGHVVLMAEFVPFADK
jgi:hypothetical protein